MGRTIDGRVRGMRMYRIGDRAVNEHIQKLIENRDRNASYTEIPVRDQAYADMRIKYADCPVKIQRAYGFAETLKRKSILIQDDDLLAGFLYQYTYNENFPMKVRCDFDPTQRASLKMDVEREVRETKETLHIQENSRVAENLDEFEKDVESWLYKHWHSGHTLAGYPRLLKQGFSGLLDEVKNSEPSDAHEAFAIVLTACTDYISRYEDLAREKEKTAGCPEIKDRMRKMGEALSNIKENPPRNFFEAIQLVSLAHEMMYCENVPSAISLGRLDDYLYPYYKKDLEQGRLTFQEAGDYVDALFVKCSSQKKAYQNLTIGGCENEDLTLLCLEACKRLKFDQPSLNFRWSENMSEHLWKQVLSLIKEGMGFPALLCDKVVSESREYCGNPEEECQEFAYIGCVEPASQGKENALTEMVRINLPKLLNLLLMNGEDPWKNRKLAVSKTRTPESLEKFDLLMKEYLEELRYRIRHVIQCAELLEQMYEKLYPLPYLSVLTEDCIATGKDVCEGGARYNSVGVNLGGIGTVADSLCALKTLVYEKQEISLQEYIKAVRENFVNTPKLQSKASHRCKKYGNDSGMPEQILREILNVADQELKKQKTYHGGVYRLGLYTVEDHAIMGMETGATFDGRSGGEALSNSMGAVQGMDKNGPTALLKSAAVFPSSHASNGMVLDLKFTPEFMETEEGEDSLYHLIRTFFRMGGMELQISVVSRETLLAAQKEPEKYGDLIVRVSGFSAYFTTLREATQNEIIKRTEYEK